MSTKDTSALRMSCSSIHIHHEQVYVIQRFERSSTVPDRFGTFCWAEVRVSRLARLCHARDRGEARDADLDSTPHAGVSAKRHERKTRAWHARDWRARARAMIIRKGTNGFSTHWVTAILFIFF